MSLINNSYTYTDLMYIANTIRKLSILEWKVYVASREFQDLPKQNAEENIEIRGGTIR